MGGVQCILLNATTNLLAQVETALRIASSPLPLDDRLLTSVALQPAMNTYLDPDSQCRW